MAEMKSKYLLRFHKFYYERVADLKRRVIALKNSLPDEEFRTHPDVKFAKRLRDASREIVPQDPNLPEYRLKGDLRKFRRYKKGMQRYRLFFCFSSTPPIIVYLYLNDDKTMRKDGDKNDPYVIFSKKVKNGEVSADPADPKPQKWISKKADI